MIPPIRRTLVIGGVVASLVVGAVSIRVAAQLAAAAAPPPAPPVSIAELKEQLAAEQAQAAGVQGQLDELMGLTGDLTSALSTTEDQVTTDGLTAQQLRDRLTAAEARLATATTLLAQAKARLADLQAAADKASGGSGGSGSSSGSGGSAATAKPTTVSPSLTLSLAGGGVRATWSACSYDGFAGYALVRSTDKEVHWPPEDRDTEVARIGSRTTTTATDAGAPSGELTYRLFCLYRHDGETKVAGKSDTLKIAVP